MNMTDVDYWIIENIPLWIRQLAAVTLCAVALPPVAWLLRK